MLNNYQIKILAAILMVLDHVGLLFFPGVPLFRIVGRFSFPLFILLLVDGEKYTHHLGRYGLRLLIFGIISQPIIDLLFPTASWNILFTLLLGLIGLRCVRLFPRWQLVIWLIAAGIAQSLNLDYGAYGIVAIALIRSLQPSLIWWAGWIALHLSLFILEPEFAPLQTPAMAAPFLLFAANHQPGRRARWFYWFYPLHWLTLWAVDRLWIG